MSYFRALNIIGAILASQHVHSSIRKMGYRHLLRLMKEGETPESLKEFLQQQGVEIDHRLIEAVFASDPLEFFWNAEFPTPDDEKGQCH